MRWCGRLLPLVLLMMWQPWKPLGSRYGAAEFDASVTVWRLSTIALLLVAFAIWVILTLRSGTYSDWP